MNGNGAAVRLSGVRKTFGAHTAVDDLDLTIEPGIVSGLLGPNGSGKTTTIRMMMGILLPDRGSVELFDGTPDFARRSRVGYLPEERGVYEKMKVLDQLIFFGEIRGLARARARSRAETWLERLGLADWASKKVQALSKGMQQKVQFISAVLHDPDLLILDEPFSGLDPINQDVLEQIVLEEKERGKTILFSTHLMEQAERLCQRVCFISRSRLVLDDNLKELKRRERSGVVAVEFDGAAPTVDWPGVSQVDHAGDALHLTLEDDARSGEVLAAAIAAGGDIRRFELLEPRLHEIFVRHAGDPGNEAGGEAQGTNNGASPERGGRS